MTKESIPQAQAAAMAARQRLLATAHELQARLQPSRLMDDAVSDVKARSRSIAEGASEAASRSPKAVAAAAGAGFMLFALRPLCRLLAWPFRRRKAVARTPAE